MYLLTYKKTYKKNNIKKIITSNFKCTRNVGLKTDWILL